MRILPKSNKVDNFLKEPVVFYCKDCEKIVQGKPLGRKFVYRCALCGTKNVAFGTDKAIRNYYRVEDTPEDKAKKEKEKLEENKIIAENSSDEPVKESAIKKSEPSQTPAN